MSEADSFPDDPKPPSEEGEYNASNKADVKKAAKKATNKEAEWENCIRGLMSVPEGRKFIWLMLERLQPQASPFHLNAMMMSMQCGMKMFGNDLIGQLNRLCPQQYIQMQQERLDHDK